MFKIDSKIIDYLISNNLTLSSVESFTGGKFASAIVDNSGASKYFLGGFVTYSSESKIDILKIDSNIISKYGTISSEVSFWMAKNVKEIFSSDISISFTGNAGPNPDEDKPVGQFYITIFFREKFITKEFFLDSSLSREEIRNEALNLANVLLNDLLLKS